MREMREMTSREDLCHCRVWWRSWLCWCWHSYLSPLTTCSVRISLERIFWFLTLMGHWSRTFSLCWQAWWDRRRIPPGPSCSNPVWSQRSNHWSSQSCWSPPCTGCCTGACSRGWSWWFWSRCYSSWIWSGTKYQQQSQHRRPCTWCTVSCCSPELSWRSPGMRASGSSDWSTATCGADPGTQRKTGLKVARIGVMELSFFNQPPNSFYTQFNFQFEKQLLMSVYYLGAWTRLNKWIVDKDNLKEPKLPI